MHFHIFTIFIKGNNFCELLFACLDDKSYQNVKVSHSLIAVGAVGVRVLLYLGHNK